MKTIPYGNQHINKDDIRAVIEVLTSEYITQGPMVPRFEEAVANYCETEHGVAVNSATSALHIACRALGLKMNDSLWTSPNTFVASANCALHCGAKVDFVDIDPRTYNMSAETLEAKLQKAEKVGSLPKIVIPVHFGGQSCEMNKIAELAQKYGFSVIEDASHAIGGKYLNKKIGSCSYSDMTIFSFHPVKIITTGEGGMILTKRKDLHERLQLLRNHGITRKPSLMTKPSDGPWYYQQIDLGYNFRMTDIQAALGFSQLQRIDEFICQRHRLANRYNEALANLPLTLPWQHPDSYSSWHLYVVRLQLSRIGSTRAQVIEAMHNAGIGVNIHYIPVHYQPFYKKLGFKTGDFHEAEKYYSEAMTLPLYPRLSFTEQEVIVRTLGKVLQ